MQIHDNLNFGLEQTIAGGTFVEIERLSGAQDGNSGHVDVYAIGIEFYARAACSGEDAAPVGIAARESRFHKRRCGDGLSDFAGGRFMFLRGEPQFRLRVVRLRHRQQFAGPASDTLSSRALVKARWAAVPGADGRSAGGTVCKDE